MYSPTTPVPFGQHNHPLRTVENQDATGYTAASSGATTKLTVIKSLENIQQGDFKSEKDRQEALSAARALVKRLETPLEVSWDVGFSVPALQAAVRTAKEAGLLEALGPENSKPKSTAELAAATKASPNLVTRLLRHLAAMHIVKQVTPDTWTATKHSHEFYAGTALSIINHGHYVTYRTFNSFPAYLQSINYADPEDGPGNWAYEYKARGEEPSMYEYMKNRPTASQNFNVFMTADKTQRPPWVDLYPTETLIDTAETSGPIFVDVGAGAGHDAAYLLSKHPEARDRLVFQDQAHVINAESTIHTPGLKAMPHDFFDPQPVHGARAYFLHTILHNWTDADGRRILANIKPAMKKGYSVLLICDVVVPEMGADLYSTSLDLAMGAFLTAKERSESEWREFLGSAGWQLKRVFKKEEEREGVLEAVPVEWEQ